MDSWDCVIQQCSVKFEVYLDELFVTYVYVWLCCKIFVKADFDEVEFEMRLPEAWYCTWCDVARWVIWFLVYILKLVDELYELFS